MAAVTTSNVPSLRSRGIGTRAAMPDVLHSRPASVLVVCWSKAGDQDAGVRPLRSSTPAHDLPWRNLDAGLAGGRLRRSDTLRISSYFRTL
jgi:hypothetical protein